MPGVVAQRSRPVSMLSRMGEHSGVARAFRNRTPDCAIWSSVGVFGGASDVEPRPINEGLHLDEADVIRDYKPDVSL